MSARHARDVTDRRGMSRGAGRRAAPPLRVTRGSGKRRSARRSALPSRVTSRPAAAFCRTVTSRASAHTPPRDITGCCPSAPLPSHRTPCRLLLTGEALITPPHNRPCTARRPAAQLGLLRHCSHSGRPRGRQRRLPGTKTQHFIYSLNTRLQSARAHSLQQVGTERPTGAAGTAPGATAVRHRKGQLQPPPEHCCRLGLHAASEPWAGFERTTKMPTVTLKRNRSSHESIEQRPGRELSSTGRCLFPSRARAQHHHPLAQPRLHIPSQGPAGHLSLAQVLQPRQRDGDQLRRRHGCAAASPWAQQGNPCTISSAAPGPVSLLSLPAAAPWAGDGQQDLFLHLQLVAVSQKCSSTCRDQQQQQLQSSEQADR